MLEANKQSSPFQVYASIRIDPNLVNVKMSQIMYVDILQEILIDGHTAGPGTPSVLIIDVDDRHQLASIKPKGDSVYIAECTPRIKGLHIIAIYWNDQPARENPGILNVIPLSLETYFRIDICNAGFGSRDVLITNPKGLLVPLKIVDNEDGTYNATYAPNDIGRHRININFDNIPNLGNDVDADIDIAIVHNADRTFNIFYTPHKTGKYVVKIKFGEQDISNGDFAVMAGNDDKYNRDRQLTETATSRNTTIQQQLVDFQLFVGANAFHDVSALVRTSTGCIHTPVIRDNQDGTISIKYQLSEVGLHELNLFC
ncbi:unnamed protein product [Rotaria sordida]|uniref:Filamin n=1 Tax=Rotaria sordida TaxID=392033 RepID=A0A814IS63_9BILA|nr:unnamed protein product [Rotaria sordida]